VKAAIGIVNYSARDDLAQYVPALLRATNGLALRLEEVEGTAYPSLSGLE
jgi:hypothetical protein